MHTGRGLVTKINSKVKDGSITGTVRGLDTKVNSKSEVKQSENVQDNRSAQKVSRTDTTKEK